MNEKIVIIAISILIVSAAIIAVYAAKTEVYADIKKMDLKLERVNESHAFIQFLMKIEKSGNLESFNITATTYDPKTGLLLDEYKKTVNMAGNSVNVNVTIPFEKTHDYRVIFRIVEGDKTLDSTSIIIKNLETLVSDKKELKASSRGADFLIIRSDNDTVRFKARFYIESMKNYDTVVRMKVVQRESNILVDENWMDFTLQKGKTNIIESEFTVPRDYNYEIKLEIWIEGKLVKTWSDYLNLAPTKIIPEGVKEEKMEFEVEKFVQEPEYEVRDIGRVPGFEAVLAAAVIGGVAIWRMRKT